MSDLVGRLEKLKKEIDETKSLKIELKTTAKKEEEIFKELIKEIRDMGFDPKTLKDDIVNMEKDIENKISSKEKEIENVKSILEEIDRNVRSL